jgi:tetratricopeptide (TPR) repeat protein
VKTIRRFFNNAEAEFARLLLVSAGIETVLPEENANTLGPGFAPGGVRLQVPDEDAERAIKILGGADEEFTPLPDDFVPPEEGPGEAVPPKLEAFDKLRKIVPASLCALAAMGVIFALYMQLAPLSWIYSSGELVRMGNAAAEKRGYAKAIKCYDAALMVSPQNYRAFYDRGLVFFDEKDYERAIGDFTEAIKLNSRHARSYRMRGSTYRRMGKYPEALADYTKAIDLDPGNFNTFCYRGWVYSKTGDAGRAIKDYRSVIERAPEEHFGYNNLAWIYATWPDEKVRNGAKALELATKACELSGWKKHLCIGTLAAAEAETGNFDDAVKHQQQALVLARADPALGAKMLRQMDDALAGYQQKRAYRDLKE